MSRRDPVASARRSSVRIDGRTRPLSSRATTGCVVPIFRAGASCVSPGEAFTQLVMESRAYGAGRADFTSAPLSLLSIELKAKAESRVNTAQTRSCTTSCRVQGVSAPAPSIS